MNINDNNNEYGVYMIFSEKDITEKDIVDKVLTFSSKENDILYCRSCFDSTGKRMNRFIFCIRKDFYKDLVENHNFKRDSEFNITKYRVDNRPLTNGTTYGFFIKSNKEQQEKIKEIFEKFETNGFIRKGSYNIKEPQPYPDGTSRDYITISFERQNNKYPKHFIKKLKALLNNSQINNDKIYINWVSSSVMKDIASSSIKSKKTLKNQ